MPNGCLILFQHLKKDGFMDNNTINMMLMVFRAQHANETLFDIFGYGDNVITMSQTEIKDEITLFCGDKRIIQYLTAADHFLVGPQLTKIEDFQSKISLVDVV